MKSVSLKGQILILNRKIPYKICKWPWTTIIW